MDISFDFQPSNSWNDYTEPRSEPDDDWCNKHYPDTETGTGLYKYNEETDEYEEIIIY